MKKINLLIGVLVLFLSVNLNAQETTKKGDKIDRLTSSLDLSKEQVAELRLISDETKKEMKVLRANNVLGDEEKKNSIKSLRSSTDAKMKAVFNAEQLEKYNKIEAKQELAKKEKRQDRMAEELGLSDEQSLALKELKEKTKLERRAITSNESLSKEEKSSQLKAVRKKVEAQTKELLTEEQLIKLKSIKGEKGKKKGKDKR